MFLKIEVIENNIKGSYIVIAFVCEPTEVQTGSILGVSTSNMEMKTVIYCRDKAGKPFKFLASQVERYD